MRIVARYSWITLLGIGLALVAALVVWKITAARAEGPPTTNPLHFTGTLTEAGEPVTGTRDVTLRLSHLKVPTWRSRVGFG